LVVFELPMPVTKGFPAVLTMLNGIPTVVDFGDIWFDVGTHSELLRKLHNILFREVCRMADLVTAPTEAMTRFLSGFTATRVMKLHYPVDTKDMFNPHTYLAVGLPTGLSTWLSSRRVVVYSGTLSQEKGCDQIPLVAKRVTKTIGTTEFGFLVIGDGPRRSAIQTAVLEEGLSDSVRFEIPETPRDVPRLLSAGSVALALSPANAISYAPRNISKIANYLAMGKPVVAVRDANSSEYVEDGKTGSLANPEALPEALIELLQSPQKRNEMSVAARLRAESDYSCEVVATKLLKSGIGQTTR
jgi:glycosyltransferase involved in cell wall biosynthesis